ncbi:hypothetical protein B0O99DRAFT_703665 [Bisporella sp. PMI_857]|nr:hypothetical protein B0O99DRAFT_703665 [Bisporella sp. PMI_857]
MEIEANNNTLVSDGPSTSSKSNSNLTAASATRPKDSTMYQSNSNNPYKHWISSSDATQQSELPEDQSFTVRDARKPALVRAVFHDLSTAHSLITSGAARARARTYSYDVTETEDENSIPLQSIGLPSSSNELESIVASKEQRKGQSLDLNKENGQGESAIMNIKNTFATPPSFKAKPAAPWPRKMNDEKALSFGISEPPIATSLQYCTSGEAPYTGPHPHRDANTTGNASFDCQDRGPRTGMYLYNEAMPFPDVPSTPKADDLPKPPIPPRSARRGTNYQGSSAAGSIPESSTIGKIYKCYIDSTNDETPSDSNSPALPAQPSDQNFIASQANTAKKHNQKPSALEVRREQRANRSLRSRPPRFALPTGLSYSAPRAMQGSSSAIGTPSSYGDSHKPLDISLSLSPLVSAPNATMSGSDAQTNLLSDLAPSENDTSLRPIVAALSTENPYNPSRAHQAPLPREVDVTDIDDDDQSSYSIPTIRNRVPLEREVSEALRRASGLSFYTDGGFYSSVNDQNPHQAPISNSISIDLLRRMAIGESLPDRSEDDAEEYVSDQNTGFFSKAANPWMVSSDSEIIVRIPIIRNAPAPDVSTSNPARVAINFSPTATVVDVNATDNGQPHDWETSPSSVRGTEISGFRQLDGFLGAKRTGSSIADISDATSSSFPEITEYGSTARIIQHPADIHGSSAYRVKTLKDTNQTVILPTRRNYNTDGYLSNSSRMNPLPPSSHNPNAMPKSYRNPFKSSPPQTDSPSTKKRNRLTKRIRPDQPQIQYTSSPSTWQTTGASGIVEVSDEAPCPTRPATTLQRSGRINTWLEEAADIGSLQAPRQHRRPLTSFGRIADLANGKIVEGYNMDGIRIDDPETGLSNLSELPDMYRRRVTSRFGDEGNGRVSRISPSRPMIQGGPGAFYRGLLARADAKKEWKKNREPLTKSVREHPILDEMLPVVADDDETNPEGFSYISPSAPPRRQSSYVLYNAKYANDPTHIFTREELDMRHAARHGVVENIHSVNNQPNLPSNGILRGTSTFASSSRRHVWGMPCLRNRVPEPATGNLRARKDKLSQRTMILCNLLWPLLILYTFGYFDCLIYAWTAGEITRFGKVHKHRALKCTFVWCFLTLAGIVAYICYCFVQLRNK